MLISLSGCELFDTQSPAPVTNKKSHRHGKHHSVQAGETLYEIAFKYGLDYRDLAKFNHLDASYKIYPGQQLALSEKGRQKSYARSTVATKQTPNEKKPVQVVKGGNWHWPCEGNIHKRFSPQGEDLHKGIDITAAFATPIVATQSGKVVYAGEGLRGYGKLLIIKHNEDFLSAYAHNHALLVKEGAQVSTGQKIALMGKSDTDEVKLHFQIRHRGKPVDPLHYLSTLRS
jgi:lipoprotein NlpD